MTQVIKKSGQKEPFQEDKIEGAVKKAVIDAGFSPEDKKKEIEKAKAAAVAMAQDSDILESETLRTRILAELDGTGIDQAWETFDQRYKKH